MAPPVTVLNVAEKPSVARALASVFSRMPGAQDRQMTRDVHQIFLQENVCFPLVFQQGRGQIMEGSTPHTMITTSVRGHLASHDFDASYGWNKCRHGELFHAPIRTFYDDDMQPLEKMLRQQARRAQALILWLDCDREGEAIGEEVQTVCLQSNARLKVFRARFSTVMPQEIQRALRSLGTLNMNFVQAVQARTLIDLRVGAAFTRFQTMRLQQKFNIEGVVSYGPCQFPTLGFVVERWAKIETFIPEDFWYLQLTIRVPIVEDNLDSNSLPSNDSSVRPIHFTWKRNRLYDRAVTIALYESCLEAGTAIVIHLQGNPKHKWRPVPLSTVELQKRASKYLRLGSEQTMTAADSLYQNGFISYPRTETEKFRDEFSHHQLLQDIASLGEQCRDFSSYATHLLSNNAYQRPRNGQNDDQAHPPITPCKAVDPNSIENAIERSIYILVVKHYLACCSKDAVGKETTLTVQMGSEEFFAKGLMILEKNWLEIYAPWERWSTGQGQLPPLEVGSRITPSAFMLQDGRTVPPRLLTEAELIALMDRNGIGTDATIATHIQTIQDRGYATKNAQQEFSPTKLGIALVEGYNSMGYQLNKPDLRREMERECNLVASGQKTMESIMGPIISKMKECFEHASAEAHKLDAAVGRHFSSLGQVNAVILKSRLSECGICQNFMALKEVQPQQTGTVNQKRKILYCEVCSLGLPLPKANEINPATELENGQGPAIKCPICQYQVLRVMASTGSTYSVCPKCYSDPPEDHGGDPTAGETFPCFKCRHPTCSLAQGTQGGDISLFGCPFCILGKITLRKTTRGSFALSCNNYIGGDRCTYSIWLPNEARIVSVPEGENKLCRRCSIGGREVHLLHFKWKPGSVPLHMGHEFQGCILCDSDFRRDMNIRLPQANQVMIPPQRRVVDRNPNSGREHGRGRGGGRDRRIRGTSTTSGRGNNVGLNIVCFRCNQPGHFANSCPQGQ